MSYMKVWLFGSQWQYEIKNTIAVNYSFNLPYLTFVLLKYYTCTTDNLINSALKLNFPICMLSVHICQSINTDILLLQ